MVWVSALLRRLPLHRSDVGAHGLECVGVGLAFRTQENVGCRDQLDVGETGLLDGIQVLSFQESAADSSSPKVHVGFGLVRKLFVDHDVG